MFFYFLKPPWRTGYLGWYRLVWVESFYYVPTLNGGVTIVTIVTIVLGALDSL